MRRAVCLFAIALSACQSAAAVRPSPSSAYVDRFYVHDPTGDRLLEFDWSGKKVGSVMANGFSTPSADGSRFLRNGDQPAIDDWTGRRIAAFDWSLSAYGPPMWSDNGDLCGVSVQPSGTSQKASLWVKPAGKAIRTIATLDAQGGVPAIQACSISSNQAVLATGAEPHWPPGATRYLITTEVDVVNLATGATVFHHVYPQGNMGGQLETGPHGDWVLVTPSPDARYLAETGIFDGKTSIRDTASGKILASSSGTARGFSSDGSRIVINARNGAFDEIQVITWSDQKVLWRGPGQAAGVVPRPGTSDLLIAMTNSNGHEDIVALRGQVGTLILANVDAEFGGPSYPGA
jgi:hypothetical protein